LHYFDNGFFNYGDFTFRGGYNHELNRYDTIAFFYTFSGARYANVNQFIDTHTFQASYGKRLTGRLAFQVAAGPQLVLSRIPVTGLGTSGSGESAPPVSSTQVLWSLTTALQWQAERNLVAVSYSHGVGGGSGVLAGAVSDIVTGSLTHRASRTFSDSAIFGYSRNDGVAIGEESETFLNQLYDYWFAGATVTHPMGPTMGLTVSYQLQYQTSNATFCIGPTCGTSVVRNLISVGFGWHDRPIAF
jgi:hypothetical protein